MLRGLSVSLKQTWCKYMQTWQTQHSIYDSLTDNRSILWCPHFPPFFKFTTSFFYTSFWSFPSDFICWVQHIHIMVLFLCNEMWHNNSPTLHVGIKHQWRKHRVRIFLSCSKQGPPSSANSPGCCGEDRSLGTTVFGFCCLASPTPISLILISLQPDISQELP